MEEIKLLYGTGNPAKLNAMKKRLSGVGITLVGLKDLGYEIPEVVEDGKTPLENARKKAVRILRCSVFLFSRAILGFILTACRKMSSREFMCAV